MYFVTLLSFAFGCDGVGGQEEPYFASDMGVDGGPGSLLFLCNSPPLAWDK